MIYLMMMILILKYDPIGGRGKYYLAMVEESTSHFYCHAVEVMLVTESLTECLLVSIDLTLVSDDT